MTEPSMFEQPVQQEKKIPIHVSKVRNRQGRPCGNDGGRSRRLRVLPESSILADT